MSLNDDELNHVRQLIDSMQSGLVELFDQLRELREHLHSLPELPLDTSPSVVSLFSEVKPTTTKPENSAALDTDERLKKEALSDEGLVSHPSPQLTSPSEDMTAIESDSSESISDSVDVSAVSAKVSRVLDPITQELRTAEATADIIMEYLQSARDYLIDEDERKQKVARDMDIVLNFLRARGNRSIRPEERDNILKRIHRWKAHLVSYSDSPAE